MDQRPDQREKFDDADDAFALLYAEHSRAIYAHIRTLVPSTADADDVFQETSTTLWQKFDQYRPDTDFRAWASRIAYYKVLKLRDRTIRSPRLYSSEFLETVSEEMVVMSDTLDSRSEALAWCREKPPRPDSELLANYYDEGSTAKKVAKRLGRSVDTVYRRIRHIHETLFHCINGRLSSEKQEPRSKGDAP